MLRTMAACFGVVLSAVPAAAEDFTGFYAGVNAGWAFERGRDGATPPDGRPGAATDASGLPPSVARIQERRPPEKAGTAHAR